LANPSPILDVRDLTISVQLPDGSRAIVVDGLSFAIDTGGTLGLVGESGSGKTMTSLAIIGLLPPAARVETGQILFEGEDLLKKSPKQMQQLRGNRVGMVLQDRPDRATHIVASRGNTENSIRLVVDQREMSFPGDCEDAIAHS